MKKLSIITICFNEKGSIEETIKSVIFQKNSDFEYIIIDGGSNDGTLDIIKKYQDRLSYFVSEKDNGIYNAMNKGIIHSNGNYLLFLNGGDCLYDDTVIDNFLSKDFKEDIVYGDIIVKNSKKVISFENFKINNKYLFNFYLPHPASFIKRDLFMKYGFYDENYKIAGDYEFFLRSIIKFKSTTKYFSQIVTIFNNNGVSSNKKYKKFHLHERRIAQIKNFKLYFLISMYFKKIIRIIFKYNE